MLSTLVKMGTCDWQSVNPRGNTGLAGDLKIKRDYDGNRASMKDYFSYLHNLLLQSDLTVLKIFYRAVN